MKNCPQCNQKLDSAENVDVCHHCGLSLVVPETLVNDSADDSSLADSKIVVVEEFSVHNDPLQIEATADDIALDSEVLGEGNEIVDATLRQATQNSEFCIDEHHEPTIATGMPSIRSINLEIPDREIRTEIGRCRRTA